ncbi:MAG TPA: DinB family protein [Thermodesulfobacteriota bacterium]
MPTVEEHLATLGKTPDDLARLIEGASEARLTTRPAPDAWAPTEVLCHLRDTEESFSTRLSLTLDNDDPRWPPGGDADRWASERQYLRCDGRLALAAFARRRAESLARLGALAPEQWSRTGTHPKRGKMTLRDLVEFWAWHDGNHVAQLARALRGEP